MNNVVASLNLGELQIVNSRPCAGFDPLDYVISIEHSENSTELYLPAHAREAWFNQWLTENQQEGCVEVESVEYDPTAEWWKAKCTVRIDGKVCGSNYAGEPKNGDSGAQVVEIISTKAKGRALSNAGFNILIKNQTKRYDDPEPIPCDAGSTITIDGKKAATANTEQTNAAASNTPAPHEKSVQTEIVVPDSEPSYEEIMNMAPPKKILSKHPNCSCMAEVVAVDKHCICYFAGSKFRANDDDTKLTKKLCQMIADHNGWRYDK